MKISALFFILIASIATAQTSGDVIGKIDLYEFIRTADELTLYSVNMARFYTAGNADS